MKEYDTFIGNYPSLKKFVLKKQLVHPDRNRIIRISVVIEIEYSDGFVILFLINNIIRYSVSK